MKQSLFILIGVSLLLTTFQNCAGVSFDTPQASQRNSSSGTSNPGVGTDFPPGTTTPGTTPGTGPTDSNGCPITLQTPTKTCRVFLTSSGSYKVPCDWNGVNNSIEAIGNGADGQGDVRAGGGGGAYSKSVNVTLVRGSTVAYNTTHIPMTYSLSGHTVHENAGDSWFCNTNSNCASMAGAAVVVGAQGGFAPVNNGPASSGGTVDAIAGSGGQAAAGVAIGPGALKYSGGAGGNCQNNLCTWDAHPGSGGGAAGPHGDGLPGGATAGAGGAGDAGFGGAGGGGGGGVAGAGGNGTEWDATHGSGGGGGGAASSVGGGHGGNYGGGGGGGGTGQDAFGNWLWPAAGATGIGGSGIVVLTWLGSSCN